MADKPSTNIITGTIAGILATVIAGWVTGWTASFWAWLSATFSSIGRHLNGTSTIPTWWLYILAAIGAGVLVRATWAVYCSLRPDERLVPHEPTWQDYKKGLFFGTIWRWEYERGQITQLTPFCPHTDCDTVLVHGAAGYPESTHLFCETCRHQIAEERGDYEYLKRKVERQIDRKVRNEQWKNHVV